MRSRSTLVDAIVLQAFEKAEPPATVVAVGGYGREELFPFSDVDLLLLVDSLPEGAARSTVAHFQGLLWDAGLHISQSVRTVEECCEIHEGNLELTISLLDHRLLAGQPSRYQTLTQRFAKFIVREGPTLVRHLAEMTRERHKRYGSTIYHLEPNVKEHPGGLRDLHVLRWLNQLGVKTDTPVDASRDFLFGVRDALHRSSGRDNNVLSFEAQDAMSPSPAEWMRGYYRNARQLFRALNHALHQAENLSGGGLLSQFRERRGRLSNHEFTVSRERVLLREPGLFESDPSAVMRLLQFVARHDVKLARDTERRLAAARVSSGWREWKELLDLPGCSSAFRALQDAGLIELLIPEWSGIDALVVRDFYHRYTVDEHTLVTIESLAQLKASKDPRRKRFAELQAEIGNRAVLVLSLLLHDIGKGAGTGQHARVSEEIARKVLTRLQVPSQERETILFLIEHHLDLSLVMSARDLEDPATARAIASNTGALERLGLLTLMTCADISAVNPQAMTPWRLDRLWRLYCVGREEFTRELESERIHAAAADEETARFLEGFPVRYARTHSAAEIRSHVELAREAAADGAAVRITKKDGFFHADVLSPDRPFLLASLSGTLAGFGVNISHAEAFSNGAGLCLDTFVFTDPHRTLELNPQESERLSGMLRGAALGKLDVRRLLRGRPKPAASGSPPNEPVAHFTDDASENATLVEVTAQDRPGLLYDLAYAISSEGLNIEVVLINTEARRALDVFYVTANGRKLEEAAREVLRQKLCAAAS